MMRWMLGILLIANISLYIWGQTVSRRGMDSSVGPSRDIGAIELRVDTGEPQLPVAVAVDIVAEPALSEARVTVCGEVILVADETQAVSLQSVLESAAFRVVLINSERVEDAGFWALVPVAKNVATAKATEQKLKAAGINDIWRFREGSLKHAISLGMYDRENSAKKRAAVVASKGFSTGVEPKTRRVIDYGISFSGSGLNAAVAALKKQFPEVAVREISCAGDFPF